MRTEGSIMKFGGIVVLVAIMMSSCLKDDSEERLAEHDRKLNDLKAEYGMTEADALEDGLYIKVVSTTEDSVTIRGTDYLILDVLGKYADNEVFDASDADAAENAGIFRPDLVYGPYRLKLDKTFYGFYMALQGLKQGDEVNMVFSQDVAFLDYQPLAYEIKIHTVIHDLGQYVVEQDDTYKEAMGISPVDTVPGTDSLMFWTLIEEGTDAIDLELGDEVKLRLYGYYVETDPNYVNGYPGRQFFPINESGDTISGEVGVQSFPVINSLYAAIAHMKIGEIRDVFIPTGLAYGEDGFVHPYVGKYIIPTYMSLHYNVQLLEHKKWDEK
jgi:FKBP-type peptidyl-prolyl cis-trans isomerase